MSYSCSAATAQRRAQSNHCWLSTTPADVPVYAISSIYSGIPDARDRDLNGINLVETPWLLGANPELRVAIAAGDTGSDNYTRLNALGADAFLLQSRFSQLQAGPDALLRGNTGLLSMDPQLRIQRELSLATFDGGALEPAVARLPDSRHCRQREARA